MTDLLEYAKRYLITHMVESGVSLETIEAYVDKIPYANPLRTHFATQVIALYPEGEEQNQARKRLLENHYSPVVRMVVHGEDYEQWFPISSFMDQQTAEKLAQRILRSNDKGNLGNMVDN